MREVIVVVGPRASGKSSFCERAVVLDPSLVLVSRDKILTELFGNTSPDLYSGGHQYALEQMWKTVGELLSSSPHIRMVLDTWNGDSQDRRRINQKLRQFGAERIVAWFFTTPLQCVEEWFWKKPGIAKMEEMRTRQNQELSFYSEDAPRRDYELFHKLALAIKSDGFDAVVRINPLITGPEQVLRP